MRRLFSQLRVGLGFGHFDEGLHLVEGEFPLRQRVRDLGERVELGCRRDPFGGCGGGDAAALDEPGHHGCGTVDPPGATAIELGDRGEELALVRGDRPVMLGHTGHKSVGPPRHRAGSGSVSEEGGCHAEDERSR